MILPPLSIVRGKGCLIGPDYSFGYLLSHTKPLDRNGSVGTPPALLGG